MYQHQLFETASVNTSETQHYPFIRLGVILNLLFCLLLIYSRCLRGYKVTGCVSCAAN